jgi:hypothetical protein
LGLPAFIQELQRPLGEYSVSISEKEGNTEMRADVPVIFFDKGIDLAVQITFNSHSP